jgi:hypothetical protein
MEPTTDHERAIAQAVDEKFRRDPSVPPASVIVDLAVSLDFFMSASDSSFLVRYVRWRSDHPDAPRP